MIGALPMYDFPELGEATDALWRSWRRAAMARGLEVDAERTRPSGDLLEHWRRTDVLLTQTCGYPYRAALAGSVAVVGTFDYDTGDPGVDPGRYRSVLVTRAGQGPEVLADGVSVAVNGLESLSGCVSLGAALAAAGVGRVGHVVLTGAHADSVVAVASGRADLASIDAVSWRIFETVRPAAVAGLVTVGHGPVVPCLPLVTAQRPAVDRLRAALADAVGDLTRSDPAALGLLRIRGFVPLEGPEYDVTLDLARTAAAVLPVELLPAC